MDRSMYEAATIGDAGSFFERIKRDKVSIDDLLRSKTPKGNNVFHLAAEFKQIDFFKDVPLDKRFPLFWAINKMGDTPMHIAARVGCDELVDLLIENAKSLHIRTVGDPEKGPSYADSYKKLLRKTNLEMHTALHVAARYGHRKVVASLMKADRELCRSSCSTKESPLFLATCKGFSKIAHDILNTTSVSTSFQGIYGVSALHAAVTHMYPGVEGLVKEMSEYPNIKEVVEEVDELGWTPLHYAAFRGNHEAIHLLLTQLDKPRVSDILDKLLTKKKDILDKSRVPYILDNFGMSAIHIASYKGHTEVMKKLIESRPDTCECLNAKDQTILHVAVLGARSNVIEYILKELKLTRLVDQADKEGNTPLHLAVFGQNQEIKNMLTLDCRVDNTAVDKGFSLDFDNFLGEDIKIKTASGLGNWEKEDPNLPPSNKAEQDREVGTSVLLEKGCDKLEMSIDTSHQGRSFGVPLFHEQISRDFKKFELHPDQNKDSGLEKNSTNNMLTATLIATVTFTAAVTPPGGFNDNGKNMLQDNAYFRWFEKFNVVSFIFSFFVLFYGSFADYLKKISYRPQKYSIEARLYRIIKLILSRPQKDFITASLYGLLGAFFMASKAGETEPRKSMSVDHWISVAAISSMVFTFGPSLLNAWIARREKISGSS